MMLISRNRSFLLIVFFITISVSVAEIIENAQNRHPKPSPLTVKSTLSRYWERKIPFGRPKPSFLFSKASPLTSVDSAFFTKLAGQRTLFNSLSRFCAAAHLFCVPNLSSTLIDKTNFAKYSTNQHGEADSFKNYSNWMNKNSFNLYSSKSREHSELFSSYQLNRNIIKEKFSTYGDSATGGSGEFQEYANNGNLPKLNFISYDSSAINRSRLFSSYSDDINQGGQNFTSYGDHGNRVPVHFKNYGNEANTIASNFNGYGSMGKTAEGSFASYGFNGNQPTNGFKSYSDGANIANDSFTGYGFTANHATNGFLSYGGGVNGATESFSVYSFNTTSGDDSFQSYVKNSKSSRANFKDYGRSIFRSGEIFSSYGEGSIGLQSVEFKIYGLGSDFNHYAKTGISFASYTKSSGVRVKELNRDAVTVNREIEPGKFFREKMLKQGIIMPMPDIRDRMPKRAFLPRSIAAKIPFSTKELNELIRIFQATNDTTDMMKNTLQECERAPSKGETKKCVNSIEEMIDFAVSVLGSDVVVRTTENVNGSKSNIEIGSVKGINGGNITKSVSCHQSLFPYLVYYCHSVPKVRVYEAEILSIKTREKINTGTAICHLDTSAWSETHGAFMALGSKPGEIEVCHWIFENDMTWAVAD